MAFSDKDIVIYPRRSDSEIDPSIRFTGANSSTRTHMWLFTYPLANGTISFEGSAGSVFSITNQTTGTIFSVNDVSGLPILTVDSLGNVTVEGDLIVNGTSTYNILALTNVANQAANAALADYLTPAYDTANASFIAANTALTSANIALAIANNSANGVANAFNKANSANYYAYLVDQNTTAAFTQANSANAIAIAAFDVANSGGSGTAAAAFNKANSANYYAYLVDQNTTAAFAQANSSNVIAIAAFDAANAASGGTVQEAYDKANSANYFAYLVNANTVAAFAQANSANIIAIAAFDKANTGGGSGGGNANSFSTIVANGYTLIANTATDILTIIAGSNIQITGNTENDSIVISSTGGGGNVTSSFDFGLNYAASHIAF